VNRNLVLEKGIEMPSKYASQETGEQNEFEESIQLEGDVLATAGGCRSDRRFGSDSSGALYFTQSLRFHFAP
jgi:hypothetical protein